MKLRFHYDIEHFRLTESGRIKSAGLKIVKDSGRKAGNIDIVFTTDDELLKINLEFLKHNYFTDIISFDYTAKGIVNGEIYISVDRVRVNARLNNTTIKSEIRRVIFHGILHLCGLNDTTDVERSEMRKLEDKYIKISEEK